MRDIPVFTTQNGVASLGLQQLAYTGAAYITIRDSAAIDAFLAECRDFCRAVGAQRILATGHEALKQYPLHCQVVQMAALRQSIPQTDGALFPVTEATLEDWRQLYNRRMAGVDNAAFMDQTQAKKLLERGDGYFVHRGERLLGIGIAAGERLDAVASAIPGAGREVVQALCQALFAERVVLEVASTNQRAIKLYESLGFARTVLVSEWYVL